MQLQNRIDPWGKLHAVPERGTWMGNRGILHNEEKQIVSQWKHKAWVTCVLEMGDYRREEIFGSGSYSELFFLDEATAFAAGHRPCAECRRDRYIEFKTAWLETNYDLLNLRNPPIAQIDKIIHNDRMLPGGGKATYEAPLEKLPPGTMIELEGAALLVWRGRLYRWSFVGYSPFKLKPMPSGNVRVLTPASIVQVFKKGLVPQVHISAFR